MTPGRPRKRKGRAFSRSETMARVRSRDTDPEVVLRRALWRNGLRYRLHVRLPGTPDVVFLRRKIAVFIDGCFWHGCPVHYTRPASNSDFWQTKLARNQDRDARVDAELKAAGWTVLRVWEHEVKDDVDAVVRRIAQAVGVSPPPKVHGSTGAGHQ